MSAFSRATASVAGFKKSKYTKTKNTQNLLQFFGNGQTTAALFNLRVIYFIQSSASMKLIKRILNSRSLFLPFKDQNRQHALFVRLLNAMHSFLSKFFGKCISLQTNSDEHPSNKVKEKERETARNVSDFGKIMKFYLNSSNGSFLLFHVFRLRSSFAAVFGSRLSLHSYSFRSLGLCMCDLKREQNWKMIPNYDFN